MDLFDQALDQKGQVPLAELLRPTTLNDFIGQEKAIGPQSPLRRQIEHDDLPSLVIWGPPGSGKSTLARIIGTMTRREFISANAIDVGAKILKQLGDDAHQKRKLYRTRTIVFVDEIHRLNKSQQDILLPFVERGDFTLIGATTENPSFELTAALLSRCKIVVFDRLGLNDLGQIIERALQYEGLKVAELLDESARLSLIALADGDARKLINFLQEIVFAKNNSGIVNTPWPLSSESLTTLVGTRISSYDRSGDDRYDLLSAFIKSLRGSDVDAALYYLARLLEGGEDPKVIARRMIVLSSEDIGNADPRALPLSVAAFQAVEYVGLPEAAINLAHVVTYLACAPKSNRAYLALRRAQEEVSRSGRITIPLSIRNAPTQMMRDLGYGKGYRYAHDATRGWQPQQFLPDAISNKKFYEPSSHGFEKTIREYLAWLKQNQSTEKSD